jgi:uncharacterized protein YciW
MIARLADLREFGELKAHFDERRERDVSSLGRKMFANPEEHERLEAERLKAFYAGVAAVLDEPLKARRATHDRKD